MKSVKFKEPKDRSSILLFCGLSSVMISKSKDKFVLAWLSGNTRENFFSENILALARPVTNRSDWSLGLPRRAFKTFLIDWSSDSAEKKRVGIQPPPPPPPLPPLPPLPPPLPFPSSSLAENYLRKIKYPSLSPPPPAPPPLPFPLNLLFISVCNLAL